MLYFLQATTNAADETSRITNLLKPLALAQQIATDTKEIFTSIPETLVTIDQQFASVIKTMGVGAGLSNAIKDNLSKGAFAILELGGDIKDATSLQNEVVEQLNKNIILSEDMFQKLYATTKVTGVASGELISAFDSAGMSLTHITENMSKTAEIARNMGVSTQAVSKTVVANLEQLNRFNFVNGVDGLAKMAAKAAALRIDMKQTLDFADKMLNPEDAINMSAALQRLGNVSSDLIDPLKLMDLAQNNVPELQNQLSGLFKQYTFFNDETQAFEFFPDAKLKLRELQKELGIPMSEIEKMALGTANLDKKLSEIDFSGLNLTEDTQNAIANLATLDKETGEYVITTKSGDLQSVNQFLQSYEGREDELKNFITGMEEEAGKSYEEKMLETAKTQLGVTGQMAAQLEAMSKSLGLSIASTERGNQVIQNASKTVGVYAESQSKMYRPGLEAGYKQGIRSEKGTLADTSNYIDKDGNLDYVKLAKLSFDSASEAAKKLTSNFLNLSTSITGIDMSSIKKSFGVEDAVYFPEQNQVINKDKNDLVVFAQKENINVGEKPIETPNIEIPDMSQSIISALQNLKIPQPINQIDPTKLVELTRNIVTNDTINNFSKSVVTQNQNNEFVEMTQMIGKSFELPIDQLRQSLVGIMSTQKPIETPKPKEIVNEVINKPKEPQNTTPTETKINHNITITFKAEGNNESLRMVANKFQNDDVFKSKIIQSLDIKKSNYQVDSDNPYQNYIQQISIA
jgi:hypothetical protein